MSYGDAPLTPEELRHLHLAEPELLVPPRQTIGLGSFPLGEEEDAELITRMSGGRVNLELGGSAGPFVHRAQGPRVHRMSLDEAGPFQEHSRSHPNRPRHAHARAIPKAFDPRQDYLSKLPKELHREVSNFDLPHAVPGRRFSYFDTSYPWSAFGRIDTGGYGPYFGFTGAMVGPRHVLLSSNVVGWHADGPTDWIVFTPCFSHGQTPFGSAYAERIYAWRQMELTYPGARTDLIALNYAVVVLNRRLGEQTGWIGSRVYDQGWDGSAFWSMSSYSQDFSAGQEPCYQDGITLGPSSFPPVTGPPAGAMMLGSDASIGGFPVREVGAPYFGWWPGEVGPHAVAVQTYFGPGNQPKEVLDFAGAGLPMVRLIQQALAEFP